MCATLEEYSLVTEKLKQQNSHVVKMKNRHQVSALVSNLYQEHCYVCNVRLLKLEDGI